MIPSLAVLAPGAGALGAAERQAAGASAGPFSTSDFDRDPTAGVGPNFVAGVGNFVLIYVNGHANNQVIWCFNESTTSGWRIQHSAGGSLNLLFNGTSRQLGNMKLGLNCGFFYRLQSGDLWGSLNGSTGVQLAVAPAYTTASAAAVHAIGKSISPNQAATQTDILACLHFLRLSGDYTPVEMAAMTNGVNENNRWQATASALADPNLKWGVLMEQWNGGAGNLPTIGSSPSAYTMQVNGTGGGKNALPEYDIRTIPTSAVADNAYDEDAADGTPAGTTRRSIFGRVRFTSDTVSTAHYSGVTVDAVNSTGNASGHPNSANCGILVNGATVAANDNTTLAIQEDGILRALDCTGIGAGAGKTFSVTPGFEQWPGNYSDLEPIKGSYPQRIRVPRTATFAWAPESPPADKLIILSDGHCCEVEDAAVVSPCYQAWPNIARANAAPRAVAVDGWFSRALWTVVAGPVYSANSIDRIRLLANGTNSNTLWLSMGVTDYNHDLWNTLTELGNSFGPWLDALHAALPSLIVKISHGAPAAYGTGANPEGWTVPQQRTKYSDLCAARPSFATYVDDSAFVTGAGIAASGNYYTILGHQQYEAGFRAVIGY